MRQQGYSLLLSLFALLGMGSVWLAGITVQKSTHLGDHTLELSRAKTALISYAVNYIDHYGAQGAGIGHLPCPDTDNPDAKQVDAWHRDGPNPPCAKQTIEQGWLPRHVNVRDGRYHFHTRSRQRLLYAVSGQFVNNPVGRIVNVTTEGDINVGQFSDVIAILATPPLDAGFVGEKFWFNPVALASSGLAFTLIRTADIRKQSMQRVGGWLNEQLNAAGVQRCAFANTNGQCHFAGHVLAHCDLSSNSNLLHWLHANDVTHRLDAQPEPIDCASYQEHLRSSFVLLEDVPIERHWFMRNEWYRFVDLSIDEHCLHDSEFECRFSLLPIVDDLPLLQLQLRPISEPVR